MHFLGFQIVMSGDMDLKVLGYFVMTIIWRNLKCWRNTNILASCFALIKLKEPQKNLYTATLKQGNSLFFWHTLQEIANTQVTLSTYTLQRWKADIKMTNIKNNYLLHFVMQLQISDSLLLKCIKDYYFERVSHQELFLDFFNVPSVFYVQQQQVTLLSQNLWLHPLWNMGT